MAKPGSGHLVAMLARWTVAMPHILHHHVTEFKGLAPQLQVRTLGLGPHLAPPGDQIFEGKFRRACHRSCRCGPRVWGFCRHLQLITTTTITTKIVVVVIGSCRRQVISAGYPALCGMAACNETSQVCRPPYVLLVSACSGC